MNLIIHVNFFKNIKKMRLTLIFGETMFHLGTNYVYFTVAPDIDNNAAPMRTPDACASCIYQIISN